MTSASSPRWWPWAPLVVAESLRAGPRPWGGLLAAGPPSPATSVARAIAQALAEPMAPDQPPSCLDAGQGESCRRLLHLLRRHGAALCADPVGSGKTYVALAVAKVLGGGPPCCIVPPAVLGQWREVAGRLEVPIVAWSHARLSRGRLPPGEPSLVIVDESHHFRNPTIRRYGTLAPWLVGRQLLLLSATPVVNSLRDLRHQLHLGLRDDVLAGAGSPSLRASFAGMEVPAQLGRHVVERSSVAARPQARESDLILASGAVAAVPALDRLRLSQQPTIAMLVRGMLLQAAASSAAALHGALGRYRGLLLHARDAASAGHAPSRRGLRGLLSGAGAQIELWQLLVPDAAGDLLCLDEVPELDLLLRELHPSVEVEDDKSTWLRRLLEDQTPTLVFVSHIETVHYLRRLLPGPWLAWCTGRRSGIGMVTMPRRDVLAWFHPGAPMAPGRPHTLLATDVGAEGLDLQRAERVVHYDLPWTEVRLAQRDGRAIRRGSVVSEVRVWRLHPADAIEVRLRQEAILHRKAGLPAAGGFGPAGRARWRWRLEVAAEAAGPATEGTAAISSTEAGWLAGIAIECDRERLGAFALWRGADGGWVDDPAVVEPRLRQALASPAAPAPDRVEVASALASLEPEARRLARVASLHRWEGVEPTPAARALGRRLRQIATAAVQNRDRTQLAEVERALAFTTGGHTAGEEAMIAELARLADEALLLRLPALPVAATPSGPITPRLVGLVAFRSGSEADRG